MKFLVIVIAAVLCGGSAFPRKVDELQCQAPNGGGLTPVLKEFIDMLPLDEIFTIYLNAVNNDSEVQAVMEFLESEDFLEIITTVTGTAEFTKLVKIACGELYLDVVYYLNVVNKILGIPIIQRPVVKHLVAHATRPGFHGMLLDIIDIIDVNALKELFIEKSKTDKYLKRALEIVKSEDFTNIIDTVHKTPAYHKMLGKLRGMGVDVDAIIEYICKYFGW